MLKEERFDHILTKLKESSKVLYEDLALSLDVSEDTIRRDVDALNKSGLLVKVRGGAISPSVNPLSFNERSGLFSDNKKIIALKTLQVIQRAKTILMDGGTTMMAVASCIPIDSTVRIITNNLAIVPILSAHENIELIILGGTYNRVSQTNNGTQTCVEAANYQVDVYLMGACAIDSKVGITASIQEEGEVKRAFLNAAFKTVVLGNQEKLETSYFYKVCDIPKIDTLITDLPSNHESLHVYRSSHIEIL